VLTGDHVRAGADDGIVTLKKLHGLSAPKLTNLAERLVETLRAHRGASMRTLGEAFAAVVVGPREVRAKEALVKLLLDASELSDMPSADAAERRLALFREAAALRASGTFDRDALLARHAIGAAADDVERALYRDLPEHRIVLRPSILEAKTLVEDFDREQARALLLSARSLTVFLPRGANSLRRLVGRAKFLGLIPAAQERGEEIAITLEGPAARFETGSRYGLAFANFLPELEGLAAYRFEADVKLGPRTRGMFAWSGGVGTGHDDAPVAREAVTALATWLAPHFDRVALADAVLVGRAGALIVPDLTLTRGARSVHLELLEGTDTAQLETRCRTWPADSSDLLVCYREPKKPLKLREVAAIPEWCFGYRRSVATKLLLEHVARFLG
jgi:predicted nuclease of restriction endonuclease-like RecB superfamily